MSGRSFWHIINMWLLEESKGAGNWISMDISRKGSLHIKNIYIFKKWSVNCYKYCGDSFLFWLDRSHLNCQIIKNKCSIWTINSKFVKCKNTLHCTEFHSFRSFRFLCSPTKIYLECRINNFNRNRNIGIN